MKRIVPLLLALLLFVGCNREMDVFDLTNWEFEYEGQWYPATVPGCIHTDLMAQGLIPDPFYGTNEDSVQWVGNRIWKYRTTITRDMWEGFEHCDLVLEGVTLCDVRIYGKTLGAPFQHLLMSPDNMFRTHRVCLFESLIDSGILPDPDEDIVIEITFYPIEQNNEVHFANETSAGDGCPEPDMDYNLPDHRAMTRMAPYMLGWDWGPKLSTVGILGGARLECHNGAEQDWNVSMTNYPKSLCPNPVPGMSPCGRNRTPSARVSPSTAMASPSL